MKDYSNYYPSFKEVVLENGRMTFEQQLNDFEGKDVLVDGIPTKALIKYHQNPLNEFKESRKITLWYEDKIRRGSYVKTVEDGRQFLVLSEINNNDLVKYALIRETNHSLKFIDSNNNLITKPCIVSAKTLYTTGIKDEKVIEIPNGMVGIQLPYDEDTKKLDRQQSFVFNKTKYEITFYNEVEFDGLIVLICTETALSTYDDKINEIADRWVKVDGGGKIDRLPWLDNQQPPIEPEIPQEPITGVRYTLSIETPTIGDDPNELWYGETYKYTVHKFVDDVEIGGNFTFELSDATKATLSNVNNSDCKVTAKDVKGIHIIKLIVTDIDTSVIAIEQTINIQGR